MLESVFLNWDLLVLGIVVIITAILGFMVYFEKPKSPTHASFLGFALWTAAWGVLNYFSYHVRPPSFAFILLKLTIFAVAWETYYFLKFSIVFPKEKNSPPHKTWWIIPGITVVVAALTLTPLVFSQIGSVSQDGTIVQIVNGPAIPAFGMTSVGFTVAGLILLLIKTLRGKGEAVKSYLIGFSLPPQCFYQKQNQSCDGKAHTRHSERRYGGTVYNLDDCSVLRDTPDLAKYKRGERECGYNNSNAGYYPPRLVRGGIFLFWEYDREFQKIICFPCDGENRELEQNKSERGWPNMITKIV